MSEPVNTARDHMDKAITAFENELVRVRTGRANAHMLDGIQVDYYGVPTPITQLAAVKSPEAHMLVVEPWDKSVLHAVEKAIIASDLGITPNNDGSVIRLPFPAPTEERRRDLVRECREIAEGARVSVRNIRRDANNKFDRLQKDSEISEDDSIRGQKEIQNLTDSYIEKIEKILTEKEAEVMEV